MLKYIGIQFTVHALLDWFHVRLSFILPLSPFKQIGDLLSREVDIVVLEDCGELGAV